MPQGFYPDNAGITDPRCPLIFKKGWPHHKTIQLAYEVSGCDLEFVALLEAENDQWTVDRVGITGDIGICQIAPQWHPWITNHPEFYDTVWQVDRCRQLYEIGERFYGADNIHVTINNFYTHD